MFFTASVFLLVSPTPEPQYIPVMLYLALCALLRGEADEPLPVGTASDETGTR